MPVTNPFDKGANFKVVLVESYLNKETSNTEAAIPTVNGEKSMKTNRQKSVK